MAIEATRGYLQTIGGEASIEEISRAVVAQMGATSPSSVRSYLNNNVGRSFERTGRGRYRLKSNGHDIERFKPRNWTSIPLRSSATPNSMKLIASIGWRRSQRHRSIQAGVTDPPYGLLEYTEKEQAKLRKGSGGVWRIPPSFDVPSARRCRASRC